MELDLMRLFEGYVRNYHTLKLTTYHGKHFFTMSEIHYFSALGSMLGYHPFTEDTCDGTYRPMDLTWWGGYKNDYWHDFVLHMERENLYAKDKETLDKLFAEREYRPVNTIGIMNVKDSKRIEELLHYARTAHTIERSLLIFRTKSIHDDHPFLDEVHAFVVNQNHVSASKKASVSDIGGTLFMHFDKEG